MAALKESQWFATKAPVVVVAGGGGFIGTRLCENLVAENLNVLCVDRWYGNTSRVDHLSNRPNFAVFDHDITSEWPVNLPKPQFIFHLVGIDEFLSGEELSLQSLLTNALGTHRLLGVAVRGKAAFCLASSIYVYEGAISSLSLKQYAGPDPADLDKYTHHEAKRFAEALVAHAHNESSLNARVVRLPDVYGSGMNFEGKSIMVKILGGAVKRGEVQIEGDGSQAVLALYVDDVIEGLKRAMFDRGTEGAIYHLLPTKPNTVLEVALLLQKILYPRSLPIRYIAPSGSLVFPLRNYPEARGLSWKPLINLEQGLRKTLSESGVQLSVPMEDEFVLPNKELVKPKTQVTPKSQTKVTFPKILYPSRVKLKWRAVVTILALGMLLTPGVIFWGSLWWGQRTLLAVEQASYSSPSKSSALAAQALGHLKRARFLGGLAAKLLVFSGKQDAGLNLAETLASYEGIAVAATHVAKAADELAEGLGLLSAPAAHGAANYYLAARVEADIAQQQLAVAEATITDLKQKASFVFLPKPAELISLIRSSRKRTADLHAAAQFLPLFLAGQEKKEYLILLVDNGQLRPGGGVVEAVGVIGVNDGHVTEIAMDNMAKLAEVLPVLTPPDDLQETFGKSEWSLRDSLWWGDFPSSAKAAQWFLAKVNPSATSFSGESLGGVIMIDRTALAAFVEAVGPITLASGKVIGPEALATLGSDESSTYHNEYSQLFQEIFQAITAKEKGKWLALGETAARLFEEKHILLSPSDQRFGQVISDLGLTGNIPALTSNMLPLGYFESAFSSGSMGLERQIDRVITVGEDLSIKERVEISLKQGKEGIEKKNPYKAVVQLWLPEERKITEAAVDGTAFEAKGSVESGWRLLAIPVTVTEGHIVHIAISTETIVSKLTYGESLKVVALKQPGLTNTQVSIRLVLPSSLTTTDIRPEASFREGGLLWHANLDRDSAFVVTLK